MVIELLSDDWVEEVNKVWAEVFVINMGANVIVGTLSSVWVVLTIDAVSKISVEVLAGVDKNVSVATVATL